MTEDQRNEPLRDSEYSRDYAIRLTRHAAWYLGFAMRYVFEKESIDALRKAQREILKMSTGDFYRIKVMGKLEHKMLECPCACHLNGPLAPPCDTCKGLHTQQ